MHTDHEACYRALKAKDSRFDGLFFVGVKTTGIYCRCVCTARLPQPESCSFFANAAAAEAAGFRPCLLCRPELAPGRARVDAVSRLASAAVRRTEDGALLDTSLPDLARELGVSDRHLRRAVVEHYGVSPVDLLQSHRLLTAKRLLTDTALPVGEVAFASGFASLRRFNAAFRERYRLSPTDLRKSRRRTLADSAAFEVAFRAPYDWESILRFLQVRAIPGVEAVHEGCYWRTVALGDAVGWLSVGKSPRRHTLRVEISGGLLRQAPQVLRRVRRLFDTSSEPSAVLDALGPIAANNPGLRVPGAFDGFEAAVRAVLGQQITVAGARTLAGRFVERFGPELGEPMGDLTRVFPRPDVIADASPESIGELGIVRTRARALIGIARAIADGEIRLIPGVDVEATVAKLRMVPGIGEWTAQYIAMRALSYPDAFPHADVGLMQALGTRDAKQILEMGEQWRPWRAYATLHLWRSLEDKE